VPQGMGFMGGVQIHPISGLSSELPVKLLFSILKCHFVLECFLYSEFWKSQLSKMDLSVWTKLPTLH